MVARILGNGGANNPNNDYIDFQITVENPCQYAQITFDPTVIENPIHKVFDSVDQSYSVDESKISNNGTSCPGYGYSVKDAGGSTLDSMFAYDSVSNEFTVLQQSDSMYIGSYDIEIEVFFDGLNNSPTTTHSFTVVLEDDPCNYAEITIDPAVEGLFPTSYIAGTSQIDVIIDDAMITSNYTGSCRHIVLNTRVLDTDGNWLLVTQNTGSSEVPVLTDLFTHTRGKDNKKFSIYHD